MENQHTENHHHILPTISSECIVHGVDVCNPWSTKSESVHHIASPSSSSSLHWHCRIPLPISLICMVGIACFFAFYKSRRSELLASDSGFSSSMASAAASAVTCWHAVAMSDHLDACRLLDDYRCPYIFSSFREAKQIEHQSTSKQNSSV